MQIVSLQAGSVVVRLKLTVQDPGVPVGVSTLAPMLRPLLASTVFQIDRQETRVQGTAQPPALLPGALQLRNPLGDFESVFPLFKRVKKCKSYSIFLHRNRGPGQ